VTSDEVLELFQKINVWTKNGQRAPHKHLLSLIALAECQNQNDRFIKYEQIDAKLKDLLIEFGPKRKSYQPELPFWYLSNDKVWEFDRDKSEIETKKGGNPSRKIFISENVSAGFKPEIYNFLKDNPKTLVEVAIDILNRNFPSSLHDDIVDSIGLDLSFNQYTSQKKRKRDSEFREKVLRAYEYKCAVCSFDLKLSKSILALEAAHIRWHTHKGPDVENNGFLLCSMHHKLFDKGAFTINHENRLLVSENVHGSTGLNDWLIRYHGVEINKPIRKEYYAKNDHLNWHLNEVFQLPFREISSL
jgi:putative restriction endonuclease